MLNAIGTDGCTTTHGGVVKATQFTATHHGKPMLKTGDGFQCPKCETWSTIMQGSGLLSWHGAKVALGGDKFTCGAELVAQQSPATVAKGNISTSVSPSTDEASTPISSKSFDFDDVYQLLTESGEPIRHTKYKIIRADGTEETGITDENGHTMLIPTGNKSEVLSVQITNDE